MALAAGPLAGTMRRGEGGPSDRAVGLGSVWTKIFFYSKIPRMISIPFTPRQIRATESRLQAIYNAAKKGLKGDTLALAAGMLPTEYRQLCQLDPVAEMAALKGRADGEYIHADMLEKASLQGDAKASLAILQHVHGWSAKQEISISVENISITQALEAARARVIEYGPTDSLLTNRGAVSDVRDMVLEANG
jgi:hypothetical protein